MEEDFPLMVNIMNTHSLKLWSMLTQQYLSLNRTKLTLMLLINKPSNISHQLREKEKTQEESTSKEAFPT